MSEFQGDDFARALRACDSADAMAAVLSDDRLEEAVGSLDDELDEATLDAAFDRALSFSGAERGRALGLLGSLATLSAAFTLARPPLLLAAKRRSIGHVDAARDALCALLDDASGETRAGAALLLARANDVSLSFESLIRRLKIEADARARAGCGLAVALASHRLGADARREALDLLRDAPAGEVDAVVAAVSRALASGGIEPYSFDVLSHGVVEPRPMPYEFGFFVFISSPEATDALVIETLHQVKLPREDPAFVTAFAHMVPHMPADAALCIALGMQPGDPDGTGASPGDRAPLPPPPAPDALMRAALENVRKPLEPWLNAIVGPWSRETVG